MGFFDDVNNKSALNSRLNKLNTSIKENYSELGTRYYNLYKDDPDPKLKELVDDITSAYEEIKNIEAQLAFIRGVVICPNCKKECPSNLRFCTSCGTQLIKPVEPVPAAQPQYTRQPYEQTQYTQNPYNQPYQATRYQQPQYHQPLSPEQPQHRMSNPYQTVSEPAQPVQSVQTDIYSAQVAPPVSEETAERTENIQPFVESAVSEVQEVHITEPEIQADQSSSNVPEIPPVADVPVADAVQFKFCTQCGTKMHATAKFCTQCGNQFNA